MKAILLILSMFLGQIGLAQPSSDATASIAEVKPSNVYVLNGRMGLQKNLHRPITPAVYDTLYMINTSRYAGKRFNSTKQQSFWGLIDASGHQVIPFEYRVLKVHNGIAVVGMPEHNLIKYGAYKLNGEVILSPKYESVDVLSKELVVARKQGNNAVFNLSGVKIFQIEADSISLLAPQYLKVNVNGKAGITRLNNDIVATNSYHDVKIDNGEVWVQRFPKWQIIRGYDSLILNYENVVDWQNNFIVTSGGKSLLVNKSDEALSASYDNIIKVNNSFSLVKNQNKWGIININGEEIIPVNYSQILSDEELLYARNTGNHAKWSIFDYYGFSKTKLKYDSIIPISEGRIAIQRNGKWGYLDRYGVEVIAPIFDKARQFKNGLAIVTFYREDGIINRSGRWVVIPTPINIQAYDNNTVLGTVNGQYQIKKFNGELVYFTGNTLEMTSSGFMERDSSNVALRKISWTGTFEYFDTENETIMTGGAGLLIFKTNGKYGFKDQRNRIIIANRYESVKPFNQRLAAIKINNKWGFINLDEQIIVQPRYDSVGYFKGNTCITQKGGLLGVINQNGDEIVSNQYQQVIPLSNGQFRVQKNGLWGVLGENGAVVIHANYGHLFPVNQGFYIVERNGKYGTIDNTGVNKIPMLYDFIGYNNESKTMVTKMAYKKEWAFLMKTHSVVN
ncbi:MAG: hypothetical protein DRI71_03100 [Bacteroidetes bacterium]|nr:MAG: hypothetical protein DRI71_03100 [Bacteroidota bacterium]